MTTADKYTIETITDVRPWTDSLFSFRTTRDQGYRFVPGQFARIGVPGAAEGSTVWRAYSIASAAHDEHLEFFSVVVPGGAFTSRLSKMKEGDQIFVERKSYGFLTTDRFEQGRDLWMLATGTGLAPFLSILHDFHTWENYENLILVQSVRTQAELAYEELIQGFDKSEYYAEFAHKLRYARIVTREPVPNTLRDRVTKLLASGVLEENLGLKLDHDRSRVMLCGNPGNGRGFPQDPRRPRLSPLAPGRARTPGRGELLVMADQSTNTETPKRSSRAPQAARADGPALCGRRDARGSAGARARLRPRRSSTSALCPSISRSATFRHAARRLAARWGRRTSRSSWRGGGQFEPADRCCCCAAAGHAPPRRAPAHQAGFSARTTSSKVSKAASPGQVGATQDCPGNRADRHSREGGNQTKEKPMAHLDWATSPPISRQDSTDGPISFHHGSATSGACCSRTRRTSRRSARPSSATSPKLKASSTSAT
jgi:ferredoxin--NADP+ reductase